MKHNTLNLLLFLLPVYCFAGAESGGGGSILYHGETAILIDFLLIDSNYMGTKFVDPLDQESFILDANRRERIPAFKNAKDILSEWEKEPFNASTFLISIGLEKPSWRFSTEDLPILSENPNVTTAAYYKKTGGVYSVNINTIHFNHLDLTSQTGLLIHEALRHIQLGWGNGFNEDSLKMATALTVLCEVNPNLHHYMFFLLNQGDEVAERIYGNFSEVVSTYCKRRAE